MNNEKYAKLKKDFVILYMARNGIATFLITILAMAIDISSYYQVLLSQGVIRIFSNSIFTTLYFFLIWIFNYLIFELYKILTDWYRSRQHKTWSFHFKKHKYVVDIHIFVLTVLLAFLVFVLPLNQLFHLDLLFMIGFMLLRSIKEVYKNRL